MEALEYLGGVCVVCGTTEKLEFDHKDSSTKIFSIANGLINRAEVFWAEVDKCQLLCGPHHRAKSRDNGEHLGGHNKWTEIQHGTLHAYSDPKYKCRCAECREVKRLSRNGS